MAISFKRMVGIIALFAVVFLLFFLGRGFMQQAFMTPRADIGRQASTTISAFPVRIRIPSIGVDAQIENVGLKPDGSLGSPKNPVDAAWYELGPIPGQKGSAVIDGHYGWKDGIAAAFDDLHKVRAGERIIVESGNGIVTTFAVRLVKTYGEHEDAASVFFSIDGDSHLNLITCGGVWNKADQSYADRLVVFADKVK